MTADFDDISALFAIVMILGLFIGWHIMYVEYRLRRLRELLERSLPPSPQTGTSQEGK